MSSFSKESTKGERTRARIREIALRSFLERGYDETTMRFIAQEAEVSLGVTNYHFPSKNHLVQEFYLEVTRSFRALASERMAASDELLPRLRIVFESGVEVLEPYHAFAPEFLSAAMSPRSPINPLSGESEPALREVIVAFSEAVTGARHRLPADIAKVLPEVLAIAYLLLALFFTYDNSPGRRRTHALLGRALSLLGMVLPLVRLPALRRPVREMLELIAEVRS